MRPGFCKVKHAHKKNRAGRQGIVPVQHMEGRGDTVPPSGGVDFQCLLEKLANTEGKKNGKAERRHRREDLVHFKRQVRGHNSKPRWEGKGRKEESNRCSLGSDFFSGNAILEN